MRKTQGNLLLVFSGVAIGIGLVMLILASCGLGGYYLGTRFVKSGSEEEAKLRAGATAPDFRLVSIDGESSRLSDLRPRPILLNFWASWCGPCVEEMPLLEEYSDKYSQDLAIVGVNADEPLHDVVDFVEQKDLSFLIFLDPDSRVQDLYKIRAFPTSYFIDSEGVIRAVHIGSLSEDMLDSYLKKIGVGQ